VFAANGSYHIVYQSWNKIRHLGWTPNTGGSGWLAEDVPDGTDAG
jgi:hypothetical protein